VTEDAFRPLVLHVNTARSWCGGEQQMVYLLRGMRERGLPAHAVCRPDTPVAVRARAVGARVFEVPMRCEMDPFAAATIARIMAREGHQILHAHTAHAHGLAWLVAGLLPSRRIIVHRRGDFRPGRGFAGLGRAKYLRGVDAYISVSNRVKAILEEAGIPPWRVFPVRSVTDPARFLNAEPNPHLREELGIPEEAFVVGNIAYLVGHKDHLNLIEAAAIVRKEIPNLWVVIVGKGPLRGQIERRARELGQEERLVLTGFRDDIPQLILSFDLFALSSWGEGICSTLLEVMASGRPIVATRAGGVEEALAYGRTGVLVPTRNPRALADGILRLARDPALRKRLVEAGRQRVMRHFTVDALTEKTLRVYRRVLEGRVGPRYPVALEQ